MANIETVIIGGGQAGLALSACLTAERRPHVVLERGRIVESWHSQRWDSLRLLTPNWMTRLPGFEYSGLDPDGYMSKDEVIQFFESYAVSFEAPVEEEVAVRSVEVLTRGGFVVGTSRGEYLAANVVVATGRNMSPHVPSHASAGLAPWVRQLHSAEYRNTRSLPPGGVLVVGAGPSGLQIAHELRRDGRDVVLSVGKHARAVRRYRGRDLMWWLDHIGALDRTIDDVSDLAAARRSPSLGLTGANGGEDLDLARLSRLGVAITGRLRHLRGPVATFEDDLAESVADAERRLRHLLARIDGHALRLDGAPAWPVPVRLPEPEPRIDLDARGVSSVVWATGYRRSYPWLPTPVLDEHGEVIQRRGVTPVPGLFTLGLNFMWRRRSHFIDGVGEDAEHIARQIIRRSQEMQAA